MAPVASKKFIITITLIRFSFLSVYALTFQIPNPTQLTFLGEAHIDNITSIRLTADLLVPTSAAGRVLYYEPVTLRDTGNQNTVSFNTSFSFLISTLNPNSLGGGLAFVMTRNNKVIGNAGGNLGILPHDDIVVEFDTFKDTEFSDINGNHVGFNIGSMISKQIFDLDLIGLSLRSGKVVNSWIDYSGSRKQLDVFISYVETKPTKPILSIFKIDLYQRFGNNMFVGLSGSTEGSTEIHRIISWNNFTSYFETRSLGPLWSPARQSMASIGPIITPTDSYIPTALIAAPTQTKCHGQRCNSIITMISGVATTMIGVAVTIILALVAYWQKGSIKFLFNNFCCSTNHIYISPIPRDEIG